MAITLTNPMGLPEIDVYRQVSVATGSKLVFVAGQVAWDADGVTIGEGDLAAQVEQCYVNVATALAGAGASFADVVLQCGSREGPLQGGSVAARIAQLYLLDVLFGEVCRRDPEGCLRRQEMVAEVLSDKHI